uniref:Acyl-CoA dehydrogenase C-terminal domain containing protein n=1 Tax=Philasterides dicentrarchi TaxID=282688 RepID=A0A481XSK3_9CILI|nr:acyl-CoA dehydrogenase C-terminal domain containing protein [Philasterides dicentrarchi]
METTEVRENHKFNQDNLKNYMIKNLNLQPSSEKLHVIQFNAGQSNPTFLITYNQFQCVMRKKPPGVLLKGAHAIDREFKIQQALHKQNFPVPQPYIYCSDLSVIESEFYLMEYMKGRIFRDLSLPGISPKERTEIYNAMCDILVKLHSFNPSEIGLDGFGNSKDYYARGIHVWSRNYRMAKTSEIKDMEEMMENLPKLIPKEGEKVSIVHGDFRLDNMVFHPTENRVIAVLDWELSTLGNPLGDLAYNLMWHYSPGNSIFGLGSIDFSYYGIPSVYPYRSRYLQGMRMQEIPDKEWFFYLAFSFFRLAGISQGVYKRSLMGNASSTKAKSFEVTAKQLARIGREQMQKSISGDIRPVPFFVQRFFSSFPTVILKIATIYGQTRLSQRTRVQQ